MKAQDIKGQFKSGLKELFGGEFKGLSKLTQDTGNELISEAKKQAIEMGANIITGLKIDTE